MNVKNDKYVTEYNCTLIQVIMFCRNLNFHFEVYRDRDSVLPETVAANHPHHLQSESIYL